MPRPRSRPYRSDTGTPCVLASERASRPVQRRPLRWTLLASEPRRDPAAVSEGRVELAGRGVPGKREVAGSSAGRSDFAVPFDRDRVDDGIAGELSQHLPAASEARVEP